MNYENFQKGVFYDNGTALIEMPVSKRVKEYLQRFKNRQWWKVKPWLWDKEPMTREDKIAYLNNFTTRELMDLRVGCYRCGSCYQLWDGGPEFTIEEIKEVLSTREHIPNKKEGKKLRQEAAKRKQ